ncbi:MAG: hypothetical protein H7Y33_18395 [Cytophagales bacterium]|nr:hypothetical protein [Rhizobacter sp.]
MTTALRWAGPLGLIFLPGDTPSEPVQPRTAAHELPESDADGLDAGMPAPKMQVDFDIGPNGERRALPGVLPSANQWREGFIRVLPPLTAADDGRAVASADPPPKEPGAAEEAPDTSPQATDRTRFPDTRFDPSLPRADLSLHIGHEGRDNARAVLGAAGEPNLLVGHGGYTVGGLRGDAVFVVPPGSAVTLARPGIAMPTRLTDSYLKGDWRGVSHIEELRSRQLHLDMRNVDYLAKAKDNDGLHPYLEGAATYLPGARVPDYAIRAPKGLAIYPNNYSVDSARFATLAELVPPNAGHVCVSSCTQVKFAGTNDKLMSLHVYAPLREQLDLPGLYEYDAERGEWVPDPLTTAEFDWDWRHRVDLAPALTYDMTAAVVAAAMEQDLSGFEAALMKPSPFFDYSRFAHPFSADPGVAELLVGGHSPVVDPTLPDAVQLSLLSSHIDRVQGAYERTKRFIAALEESGLHTAAAAASTLKDDMDTYLHAARLQRNEVRISEMNRMLETDWDMDD